MKIEIDSIPQYLYEHTRDWSGFSISRLLTPPLFQEEKNRNVSPVLIEKCVKEDDFSWSIYISDRAKWDNGEKISSHDFCQQIKNTYAAKAAAFPLLLHFKHICTVSEGQFKITTRMPIAHIDRILCNPAFSPHHKENCMPSGAYRITKHTLKEIEAVSGRSTIKFIEHTHVEEGLFESGHVNISGPMTVAPEKWDATLSNDNAYPFDMDIIYALDIPDSISAEIKETISLNIDRKKIFAHTNGSFTACNSFCTLWGDIHSPFGQAIKPSSGKVSDIKHNAIPILYTNFTGNKEIAFVVSEEIHHLTGIKLLPTLCDYSQFISTDPQEEQVFRIILTSSLWPHPASLLTPFRFSQDASQVFAQRYDMSVAENDLHRAQKLALHAEEALDINKTGIIPLGKIKGCFRSNRKQEWWPPSGWLDTRNIVQE